MDVMDMESSHPAFEDETPIELMCDTVTYCVPKSTLVTHCDYFKALYSGNFTDSDKTWHDLSSPFTEGMVTPLGLKEIIIYFNNPSNFKMIMDIKDMLIIAKTASYLQCTKFEEKIWNNVFPKLTPENCLDTVRYFDYESQYTKTALELTMSRILWKFADGSLTSDINCMEPHEMFWLLKNPFLQDPLGGLGILGVVDEYVEALVEREKNSQESEEALKVKYLSLFLHAYIEGASSRIDRKFSFHSTEGGTLSLLEQLIDAMQQPASDSIKLRDVVNFLICDRRVSLEYSFYLSESEKKLIESYMTYDSVFKLSVQMQKSNVAWLPCSVIFKLKRDDRRPYAMTYDPILNKINFVTQMKYWFSGTKVSGYGSQIILVGGEKTIGTSMFCNDLYVYDTPKGIWSCIETPPHVTRQNSLNRRSFASTWLNGNTLVIAGGYELFRIKSQKVTKIQKMVADEECRNPKSKKKEDSSWISISPNVKPYYMQSTLFENGSIDTICCLEVVHQHVFVFASSHNMEMYCPTTERWRSRTDVVGWPKYAFTDAFAYGAGIYLISSYTSTVYWMLIDVIDDVPCKDSDDNLPLFEIIPYGKFQKPPYGVCRVENVLYSFTQDFGEDVPVIERMYLEHNPLENLQPKTNENTDPEKNQPPLDSCKSDDANQPDSKPAVVENIKVFESSDLKKLMINQQKPEYTFTKNKEPDPRFACSVCRWLLSTDCRRVDGELPIVESKEVWRGQSNLAFQLNSYENLSPGCFPLFDPFLATTRKS